MSDSIRHLTFENDQYTFGQETRELFTEHVKKLDQIAPNQIMLDGVDLIQQGVQKWQAQALIVNTTKKTLKLQSANLAILDKNGRAVAKKEEDFAQIARTVEPYEAKAIVVEYQAEDFIEEPPYYLSNWKLAFERPKQAKKAKKQRMDWTGLEVDKLDPNFKKQMEASVAQMILEEGELNFSGLDAMKNKDDSLTISLLVSNASDDHLTLRQISLSVYDATNDLVAQGTFPLRPFRLHPWTSRPMLLEFPPEGIDKPEMDLSRWRFVVHEDAED